jgi:hypothetical protein
LPNLALDTLDEVIEKVCDGLKQLESDPERLRSLTSFPHFRLAGENAGWYKKLPAHAPHTKRKQVKTLQLPLLESEGQEQARSRGEVND